jgi:uridine kinase
VNASETGRPGTPSIVPGVRRTTVQARLSDGRVFEAPLGTPLTDIIRVANQGRKCPVMAAIVDGLLQELSTPLVVDAEVIPLETSTTDGARVYRRSLSFVMLVAAAEVFPESEIFIEHSATTIGGYYCEVRGHAPFTQDDLDRIERRMRDIVAEDAPIVRTPMALSDAISLFRERGEDDKARLLAHRLKDRLELHALRGRLNYFQGYMVPSTGCLQHFSLRAFPPGFILQFPHQSAPTEIGPLTPYPKLFAVFEQAGHWLDRLGIRGAGALNDAILAGRGREVSLVAEAFHEAGLARIAADIARRPEVRVVLVAGPTSSGKTTFAKRLGVQLLVNGIRPLPVGLDDYFVDRELTPRDEMGEFDYETIGALDIGLFNQHLAALIAGTPTTLPHYNFLTGGRETGQTVSLGPGNVIIVEGIHGLNPELVPGLPPEMVYRVYVSSLTQLNLDRHNRVATSDCRLIRRVVRDARARGYTSLETLRRWPSVVRGEKQHIFCFQENADAIFNSALVHELAVLRPMAEPLLLQVRPNTPEYLEANRLLSFLQWFRPAPTDLVPDNSILREFTGGSILERFELWPTPPPGRDDDPHS